MARRKFLPLRRRSKPGYLAEYGVGDDSELLRRYAPSTGLGNGAMAAALAVGLAVLVSGCGGRGAPAAGKHGMTSSSPAAVASLGLHGQGLTSERQLSTATVGSNGIETIIVGSFASFTAQPVFMSEEEAREIIKDELSKVGVRLSRRDVELREVMVEGHEHLVGYNWLSDEQVDELREMKAPLVVDLLDPDRQVAIEFISEPDYYPLGGRGRSPRDLMLVADSVRQDVIRQGRGMYFGVFYDPVEGTDLDLSRGSQEDPGKDPVEAAKAESRRVLHEQVKDFVEWLKGQGVI
jgi:hypothetical protein